MGWKTKVRFPGGSEKGFFSSKRPDRPWVPPSLLFDGYRG